MTLNHLHLGAADVAVTRAFYEHYFGFYLERQHGAGVFLRDGAGFLLALDPVAGVEPMPASFHLGFMLTAEDDVHRLWTRVQQDGAHVLKALVAERGDYAAFHLADPDGRRVEVSWHAE